ncbi:DNA-directed RNA polymerase sigma-70 factor [Cytophagales bacterium WSM2-2]|nr:DNA-directed RNA polymerase sigma-70 factor [Cytophagales bacterium WSM2-2]
MSEKEFETCFNKHYETFCLRVALIINDRDVAEDLVQEAFVKFWENKPAVLNQESIPAYISKMAVNNALMYLRTRRQTGIKYEELKLSTPLEADSTEAQLDAKETENLVTKALLGLPPACRQVFILSRYEEMSYKEIAEELDISVKTVENHIGTALKRLRAALLSLLLLAWQNFI